LYLALVHGLENPNLQGQAQVESSSKDLGAIQNGSTAESTGGIQAVTSVSICSHKNYYSLLLFF